MSSCVATGLNGQHVLMIDLPHDPIRVFVVEKILHGGKRPPQIQLLQEELTGELTPQIQRGRQVNIRQVLSEDGHIQFEVWWANGDSRPPERFPWMEYRKFLAECQKSGIEVHELP